ncbi:hypothetical protein PMIN01_00200 [Paraphaeosphaeria minitans]|uniref:Uncharacterized protein n=1 Tax=Paraphaeosphaeria minitans TaxID=565426 RepID=A0A9P6GRR9_9PLEO|nr:hypothetical protein PMIN01_00200 [Paraphaeosphaeria minitans]
MSCHNGRPESSRTNDGIYSRRKCSRSVGATVPTVGRRDLRFGSQAQGLGERASARWHLRFAAPPGLPLATRINAGNLGWMGDCRFAARLNQDCDEAEVAQTRVLDPPAVKSLVRADAA